MDIRHHTTRQHEQRHTYNRIIFITAKIFQLLFSEF